MISNEEVKNLASLARVGLAPEEETKLAGELGRILDYVSELRDAMSLSSEALAKEDGVNLNSLREDSEPLATPEKGEFVKVKKIL